MADVNSETPTLAQIPFQMDGLLCSFISVSVLPSDRTAACRGPQHQVEEARFKKPLNMFASYSELLMTMPRCSGGHQGFRISWFYPLHFGVMASVFTFPRWIRMG